MMKLHHVSIAEKLLDIANAIKFPKDELFECEAKDEEDGTIARIKTALELDRRSAVFKFRAIVEDWDIHRIIRELY
mgnify:FL=1